MSTIASLTADLKIRAPLTQDNPAGTIPGDMDILFQLSNTLGPKRHYKTYTIAASSAQSLDLASALADGFGTALTFSTVKFIAVQNLSTSATAAATVERPANGVPFLSAAGTVPCNPGFIWMNKAGTTVTASTGDLIAINNSDASASADIRVLIVGT